jgi:hypothetical protein
MIRLSVVIPTAGRETLENTVESVLNQLRKGDQLIVVGQRPPEQFRAKHPCAAPGVWIHYEPYSNGGIRPDQLSVRTGKEPGHPSGAEERDLGDSIAVGTHLLHIDDDDIFTKSAFDDIRRVVAENPERVHIFQMQYGKTHQWVSPYAVDIDGAATLGVHEKVCIGNFGGMEMVFPRVTPNPKWVGEGGNKNVAEDFFVTTRYLQALGTEPIWPHITIGIIRPSAAEIEEHTGRIVKPVYAPQVFWNGRNEARRVPGVGPLNTPEKREKARLRRLGVKDR